MQALTGCDTVSTLYGIGKIKAWKVLKQGHLPQLLGDADTSINALEATAFDSLPDAMEIRLWVQCQ